MIRMVEPTHLADEDFPGGDGGGGDAYEAYFELCVRRVHDGAAPDVAMTRTLRRLARAAGLRVAEANERFVRAIWQAPVLEYAPMAFWTSYRAAFVRICRGNAAEAAVLRAHLLALFPRPIGGPDDVRARWLAFLEECGALDALRRPDAPPSGPVSEPASGPALEAVAWFSRMCCHRMRGRWNECGEQPEAMFALLRELAPRMRAEIRRGAEPLCFERAESDDWRAGVDVDLLDLALELGIEVAPVTHLNLEHWSELAGTSPERPRALVHFTADPRFAARLDEAVDEALGSATFRRVAAGCAGLAGAVQRWFAALFARVATGALPAFERGLAALEANGAPGLFDDFPDLLARAAALDPAPALARTVRNGLLDEFVWPAFERACAELGGGGNTGGGHDAAPGDDAALTISGAFPYLVVRDGRRAIVVGPRGRVLDHGLAPAARDADEWTLYAGGALLVAWSDAEWNTQGYWSSAPDEHFEVPGYVILPEVSFELPDGAISFGARAVRPGDRTIDTGGVLLGDGERLWTTSDDWDDPRLLAFDPHTGQTGPASLPPFFEAFLGPGATLSTDSLAMYPTGRTDDRSPLGTRGGLYAWRVRRDADGTLECEGIDGRAVRGELAGGEEPVALLAVPGAPDGPWRPVDEDGGVWEPAGNCRTWSEALATTPSGRLPRHFWHFLEPRDRAGSARLRALGDDEAAGLLDAAYAVLAAGGTTSDAVEAVEAAIAACLPELTDRALVQALARLTVRTAERTHAFRGELAAHAAPRHPAIDDGALSRAVSRYFDSAFSGFTGGAPSLTDTVARAMGFLLHGDAPGRLDVVTTPWQEFFGFESALAFMALAIVDDPAERAALVGFLRFWARLGLLEYPGRLRRIHCTITDDAAATFMPRGADEEGIWALEHGGNRFIGTIDVWETGEFTALEYAPNGEFVALPGAAVATEWVCSHSTLTTARLDALTAALETHGPRRFEAARAHEFAARTGLDYPRAALVWAGLPGIDSWERNFIPRALRRAMDLELADALDARDRLREYEVHRWLTFFGAALPRSFDGVWSASERGDDHFVIRMSEAWTATFGR